METFNTNRLVINYHTSCHIITMQQNECLVYTCIIYLTNSDYHWKWWYWPNTDTVASISAALYTACMYSYRGLIVPMNSVNLYRLCLMSKTVKCISFSLLNFLFIHHLSHILKQRLNLNLHLEISNL